jgi:iron(III) transport system substrate-binding protein
VTALRVTEGEEKARQWLKAIQANQPQTYRNNTTIVQAIADGEIDVGFVNHYYLMRFLSEHGDQFPVRNWSLTGGDAGALINVAGAGVLASAKNREAAVQLIDFLLSHEAQTYFAEETHEYPLAVGMGADPNLVPLAEINSPEIDLSDLEGLEKTLNLMRETGVLR